jgi:hypothetical protein
MRRQVLTVLVAATCLGGCPGILMDFLRPPLSLRERVRGEGGRAKAVGALALAALLTACVTEPWVKPYERGWLADPLMSFSRDPLSDKYLQHVYDVRESARGAGIGRGGGCGCN